MRRSLLSVLLLLCPTVLVAPLPAQGCAATPEAAAQTALGGGVVRVSSSGGAGFRVQDVQLDPVLRRVWVRVRRCDKASAPAVLVPLLAPVNSPMQTVALQVAAPVSAAGLQVLPSAATNSSAEAVVSLAAPRIMLVHAGDAVRVVFTSSAVHMELEATANQQGAVGDTVQVTLKRRANQPPDEPEHRMRGTVRADKSIEVQP